jgi:hypothetical protein
MDHCHRQLAAFDHDLCTRAYPRQQASEVAGGFRFRDVDDIVSHRAIIQSFFLVRFSFQSGQQFAPVLLGRSSGSTSRKETNARAHWRKDAESRSEIASNPKFKSPYRVSRK